MDSGPQWYLGHGTIRKALWTKDGTSVFLQLLFLFLFLLPHHRILILEELIEMIQSSGSQSL
jgi:hypothetical protein